VFEEQLLNPSYHVRKAFKSGVAELDNYLHCFAAQQSKKSIAVVRVLVNTKNPTEILGYYSLSAAQIDVGQMDAQTQKMLPRYPVPCFRLGRLAAHIEHRGQGIGRLLLGCAMERCLEARKHVGAYALIVDAKNEAAQSFYAHYGFTACNDNPMTMYLSIAEAT
jgi:predicted GNAT family N-acyltransferase